MRWEIRAPWPSLTEVERRFDEILRSRWGAGGAARSSRLAVVASEIRIEMDLPGVSEEDVSVRVEEHAVIIEGRSTTATQDPSAAAETQPGFRHQFPLPPECNQISHEFKRRSGVLSIRVRAHTGDAA